MTHCHLCDVEMRRVASTPTGFDSINVYECSMCGAVLTLQMMSSTAGYPAQVRTVSYSRPKGR